MSNGPQAMNYSQEFILKTLKNAYKRDNQPKWESYGKNLNKKFTEEKNIDGQ